MLIFLIPQRPTSTYYIQTSFFTNCNATQSKVEKTNENKKTAFKHCQWLPGNVIKLIVKDKEKKKVYKNRLIQ